MLGYCSGLKGCYRGVGLFSPGRCFVSVAGVSGGTVRMTMMDSSDASAGLGDFCSAGNLDELGMGVELDWCKGGSSRISACGASSRRHL